MIDIQRSRVVHSRDDIIECFNLYGLQVGRENMKVRVSVDWFVVLLN